jgi:hypothetical protein
VDAASADLQDVANMLGEEHDPALHFRVDSIDFSQPGEPRLIVKVQDSWICKITTTALLRALKNDVGPVDLVAFAVARQRRGKAPIVLGDAFHPKRVGRAVGPTPQQMRAHRRVCRHPAPVEQVEDAITEGLDLLIVGKHGSGRTALAAVVAQEMDREKYGEIWLSLSDPGDGAESVVTALMMMAKRDRYLVVVDDLQANLPTVQTLFSCILRLRKEFDLTIQVLATSVAEKIRPGDQILPFRTIKVEAGPIIGQMMNDAGIADTDRDTFRQLAGDDVHIAAQAIDMYKASPTRQIPTEKALQEVFAGGATTDREQGALYYLACLGSLGLVMRESDADDTFGRETMLSLLEKDLVHRSDGAFTIAPRRRAWLIMKYASAHWPVAGESDKPEEIVWSHLQGKDRLIRATLSQIDSYVEHDTLSKENSYLLSTWDMSEKVVRWLETQTELDCAWKNNLGSAVFAASALAKLQHYDKWLKIATWVRSRWRYDDPALMRPEPVGGLTTDAEDFDQIAAEMVSEDAAYAPDPHPSGIPATDFDPGKAYRNWALGLLLCLEGTAPLVHREPERIKQLLAMAARAADEETGCFYPPRVPWVTARIVIGMCHAEVDPGSNQTIAAACRWLHDLVTDPGRPTWWRSGTGRWNSDESATAMCVVALTAADLSIGYRKAIGTATAWLTSPNQKANWTEPDREIDLAQVVQALALRSDPLLQEALGTLIERTIKELKQPTPRDELPQDRLRLPFFAAQLTEIVWQIVPAGFVRLLRDVMSAGAERALGTGPAEGPAAEIVVPARSAETVLPGLSDNQLRRWLDAANLLGAALTSAIKARSSENKSGVASVQQKLNQSRRQRDDYLELRDKLGPDASRETLEALDALGRQVCGAVWLPLPYPDSYGDGDTV